MKMTTEVVEDKVDLVAREIELTKLLASNDPKTRNDGIKQIKRLLQAHSGDTSGAFELSDYMILWRGLFYFMWMSDKLLPQENATDKISGLFHCCTTYQGKTLFLEAFFLTIKDEWMSISQHRIDKFMMLVRRCLRQALETFVECDWNLEYMQKFNEVLYRALKSFTLSLRTHLQEIFLEELAKVSKGKIPSEALVIILDAFLHYISELNDFMLIKEVVQNIFRNLLSQSPDLEILEAKFEAWRKMGKPGKSYNDLELVEGDIADDDANENFNGPLDPRAGNVNVEIPRIKFNPKDVANIINKYITQEDCTRKCLVEITKLLKWYNRLGDGMLPYKPKDLKLNSQVLKRKKKKHLSKMVKEGVKKLEMIDSKIKKSGREVIDNNKSLKELNKLGEIIVEHGKVGKSVWKVRKFDENEILKENCNVNASWTVSDETNNDETNETECVNDDEPPLLVPAGFQVEVSENLDKTPSKSQNQTSVPSLKSLTTDPSKTESNSKKRKSPNANEPNKITKKSNNSPSISIKSPKSDVNTRLNNASPATIINDKSVSESIQNSDELAKAGKRTSTSTLELDTSVNTTKNNNKNPSPKAQNTASVNIKKNSPISKIDTECNVADEQDGSNKKIKLQSLGSNKINNVATVSKSPKTDDNNHIDTNTQNGPDDFMSKIKRRSGELNISSSLNESWTVCNDKEVSLKKHQSPKSTNESITLDKNVQNSKYITNISPKISDKPLQAKNTSLNSSWSVTNSDNDSAPAKISPKIKSLQTISLFSSPKITPDKIVKSPKSPKSPTPEQRVLRRRTIIIPKKKPEEQNEGTPKKKTKVNSVTKTLQKRRKTIAGEEIGMLKLEEISNKALEKVRSEVYGEDFDSPRKSDRLSIKTDSAKKRVEFQLKNNVAQELMEYETTLVTKPANPHDASKRPVQGVLKLTPDVNRINPFYKFHEKSIKKNARKSMI